LAVRTQRTVAAAVVEVQQFVAGIAAGDDVPANTGWLSVSHHKRCERTHLSPFSLVGLALFLGSDRLILQLTEHTPLLDLIVQSWI